MTPTSCQQQPSPPFASNRIARQASISNLPNANEVSSGAGSLAYSSKGKFAKSQNKVTRAKRCKSLLMLSSPFSHSLLSLLSPSHSNGSQNQVDQSKYLDDDDDDDQLSQNFTPSNQQQQQQRQPKRQAIKMKLFDQSLDKLCSLKALRQFEKENYYPPSASSLFHKKKRFSTSNYATHLSTPTSTNTLRRAFSSYITTDSNNNHNSQQLHSNELNEQEMQLAKKHQFLLFSIIPEPIKNLLNELYLRGPETVGIFRRSPNAKHCKELKHKLETDSQSSIENFQVTVIASVFKVSLGHSLQKNRWLVKPFYIAELPLSTV